MSTTKERSKVYALPAVSTADDYAKANLTPPTAEEQEAFKNFKAEPVVTPQTAEVLLAQLAEWALEKGFDLLKKFIESIINYNPQPKEHSGNTPIYAKVGQVIRIYAHNVDDDCTIFMNNKRVGGLSLGESAQFLSPEKVKEGMNYIVCELRNSGGGGYGVDFFACRDGQKNWESQCIVDGGEGPFRSNHVITIQVYGQK